LTQSCTCFRRKQKEIVTCKGQQRTFGIPQRKGAKERGREVLGMSPTVSEERTTSTDKKKKEKRKKKKEKGAGTSCSRKKKREKTNGESGENRISSVAVGMGTNAIAAAASRVAARRPNRMVEFWWQIATVRADKKLRASNFGWFQ
jgi:hypothetical protein